MSLRSRAAETLVRTRHAWTRTGSRERVTSLVRPAVSRLRGRVLDVGGGRGAPHDPFWPGSTRRVVLDVEEGHVPDVVGDALRLPFADGSFDAVVIVETLEHLAEPWTAAGEIRRVLKDGGLLFGTVAFVYPVHGDPDDYYRFTASGLRYLFRGFSQVRVVPHGNHVSAAWAILGARSRALRVLNPVLRTAGRRADARCPQGYAFWATARAAGAAGGTDLPKDDLS